MTLISKSFQNEYSLDRRKHISAKIRNRYKDRLPIIVERAPNSNIPEISKKKFLAPCDMIVSKFVMEIRKHLEETGQATEKTAIFLFVKNNTVLPPTSNLISTIYELYKNEDGFLYITYSGENTFG
ncbi:MAP1-LC3 domain-containing protein [Heterostelium album PN500]|uniref:Autophagy-related protein n=1 Tax=Heterostelium pallidum (strain ATCC 26659 / Pp 5 / PN500) TaxID=670386 RepID=D3B1C3_HETP5|nr:MAP1-LC3 domain-containing protein [Heterostelium album PN500]EFA85097.1 MAP1-LC3 domain-containing protein [Heterostelium album PN500]|eukprot:XP_020437206.1 MAP1-LC3 domain-containing protein [Heterostelium album PN500]